MATVKTQTKKTGNTIQANADARVAIPDARRGLYAYVGVADLAVEKLKTLPELQEQVVAGFKTQVRELPQTLRAALTEASESVSDTYGELADRGEKLVTSIRRAPATRRAEEQVKIAKAQAKGARTSVRKAADSTVAAAEAASNKIG